MFQRLLALSLLLSALSLSVAPYAQVSETGVSYELAYDPIEQSPSLLYDEARAVYLGNLARRQNGVPPLRWNLQMTHAARWFSWDSTENRPDGFCDHRDTQGRWPSDRIVAYGFRGWGGAENAFCGYVTPEDAIEGWMNSPGHRANLLDPNSREVGLGYYRRASDGRGYVTQDFGVDTAHPPVVIENEALSTTTPQTSLYIYDGASGSGFLGRGPSTEMQVSNNACFAGVSWEPYVADRSWTLAPGGDGWRQVYVRTRDALNRTSTVSDTIYVGATLSVAELGASQLSTTRPDVTLYGLDGGGLSQAQFSLGWMADDTTANFGLLWGTGERVDDPQAWGGSAFRLGPPVEALESSAWVWTTEFFKGLPLVAYVRLKVADNASPLEVARFSVTGGSTLSLKGTDFRVTGEYQEFPLAFTLSESETFLTFQFWRSAATDVYVDAVSIFTAPQPFGPTTSWTVPGSNYRGQGIWVRYTDGGSQFSDISEANSIQPELSAAPASLSFFAPLDGPAPQSKQLQVSANCPSFDWQVHDDAAWLQAEKNGNAVTVSVDQSGLNRGTHTATITVSPVGAAGVAPVSVPVVLTVVERTYPSYLPLIKN